MRGAIREYAWGSCTFIPELLGEPSPAERPQAELWLGAHPSAPSVVGGRPLDELVAADPAGILGSQVVAAFGARLPFLVKVLAAERPLSLQVHPSADQAATGFAREEAAGIRLDDARRAYVDDWPKPELICALTELEAMCGFRPVAESRRLVATLARLGAERLAGYVTAVQKPADLRRLVEWLLTLDGRAGELLVDEVARACQRVDGEFAGSCRWGARLADAYPGDVGVVVALLLNYVRLAPGDALYLPAGRMHAYLRGAGVEVMATSDNVLRGGLTAKRVDVAELLAVLDVAPERVPVLRPRTDGTQRVYRTDAPYFELSRVEVTAGGARLYGGGPQILLCVEGSVRLRAGEFDGADHVVLSRGGAAFAGAATHGLDVQGRGVLFRATVPGMAVRR